MSCLLQGGELHSFIKLWGVSTRLVSYLNLWSLMMIDDSLVWEMSGLVVYIAVDIYIYIAAAHKGINLWKEGGDWQRRTLTCLLSPIISPVSQICTRPGPAPWNVRPRYMPLYVTCPNKLKPRILWIPSKANFHRAGRGGATYREYHCLTFSLPFKFFFH